MQKLSFPDIEYKEDPKRRNDLAKEPKIKTLLDDLGIDIKDVDRLSLLEDYLLNNRKCDGCKGLNECRQEVKGQRIAISYDGVIFDELEYCPYYRKALDENSYLSNLVYSDIPQRLSRLTLDDLKAEMHSLDSKDDRLRLFVLLSKIAGGESSKGLYIYGSFGVGKTYMCIAFMNTILKNGKRGAFVKVNNFINRMRKLIVTDDQEYEDILDAIKNVPYLILDDIGSETISAYSRDDLLFNILDYRMERDLLCLFTSNLGIDDLEKMLTYDKNNNAESLKAKRLMERIKYLAYPFHLSGENRRFK